MMPAPTDSSTQRVIVRLALQNTDDVAAAVQHPHHSQRLALHQVKDENLLEPFDRPTSHTREGWVLESFRGAHFAALLRRSLCFARPRSQTETPRLAVPLDQIPAKLP